jgi:Uma2 family endonuclease
VTGPKADVKLTYREYRCFPQDGRRHELIDGEHKVNPAPETYHQTLSRRIQFQLYVQIEQTGLGVVFDAPTDLQLSETDVVQPDLIVVSEACKTIITPTKIKGVPDLVVEILSPSSERLDRDLKRELYRRSGIREYWIVDPAEHTVEQCLLSGDRYQVTVHSEAVALSVFPGIAVNLVEVW